MEIAIRRTNKFKSFW